MTLTSESNQHVVVNDTGILSLEEIEQLAEQVRRKAWELLELNDEKPGSPSSRQIFIAVAQEALASFNSHRIETAQGQLTAQQMSQTLRDVVDYATGQKVVNWIRKFRGISDVMLNGTQNTMIHYRNGQREKRPPFFTDLKEMGSWLRNLRMSLGLHDSPFDPHHPSFDARLPDGIRVNASHTANTTYTVSFRIPNREITTLDDLVNNNTIDVSMRSFLQAAVAAKLNIIIAGGTGAGKTALMLCMLGDCAADERVVTIEDRVELDLAKVHPHLDVVELEAVEANAEGIGEVTTRALMKSSLRMHPDRVVVGEARDEIARELLQAMVTGNEGSMSTIHARSPGTIVERLIDCSAMAPDRVADSVRLAVDLFIHIDRFRTGERRITEVSQVSRQREADGMVRLTPIFTGGGAIEGGQTSHAVLTNKPGEDVGQKLQLQGWTL